MVSQFLPRWLAVEGMLAETVSGLTPSPFVFQLPQRVLQCDAFVCECCRYYESLLAHVAYDSQLQQPANTFEEERTAAEDGGDGSGDADAYGDIDLAGAHELEAEEAAQRQRQWRQRQWRQRDQVVHRQEGGGISIVQRGKLSPPVT